MVPHDAKVFLNVDPSAPENCFDQNMALVRLLATPGHELIECRAADCSSVARKLPDRISPALSVDGARSEHCNCGAFHLRRVVQILWADGYQTSLIALSWTRRFLRWSP